MKIKSSLKSLKSRDLNSKLVRRRGRVYIINKKNPKFKARQKQSYKFYDNRFNIRKPRFREKNFNNSRNSKKIY